MSLIVKFSPKNIHRLLAAFLLSILFFLGMTLGGQDYNNAFADVLKRDATAIQNDSLETLVDQADDNENYEVAKAQRREAQAKRSEKATDDSKNESVADKLNLDEITSTLDKNASK